jgi:hypothetical protein
VLELMHTTLERYTVSVCVMSIVGTAVVRKIRSGRDRSVAIDRFGCC